MNTVIRLAASNCNIAYPRDILDEYLGYRGQKLDEAQAAGVMIENSGPPEIRDGRK